MAVSTTQSIWRSGGGDQTRTAYCGSGSMVAQFYIANAASTSSANVTVSNGGANLVLPAGAVITDVMIPSAGASTGHVDLGTTGVSSGTASAAAIASNLAITAGTTAIGSVVTGTATTELVYVTAKKNTDGTGAVTGYLRYYVVDPLTGQQNV